MSDQEVIRLLRSIDASLKALVTFAQSRAKSAPGQAVASDRDLDGPYGNPEIKFMPRDWSGPSFKGRKMSNCPAELLDMLAETYEYFAGKAEQEKELTNAGKPVAPYKRADAARARGWAARVRAGLEPKPAGGFGDDAEVQF